jgi:phosphatidylserine decarboxylase
LPFWIGAAALAWFGHPRWAVAALALGLLVLLFFRVPARSYSGDPANVIAAADGTVTRIDTIEDPLVGAGKRHRVVTFLSPLDVHVQVVPVSGRVVASSLVRGKKVAAFRDDADRFNENHLSVIERENGDRIGIRQIVGAVARRIVCTLKPGQQVAQGQPMGLIKFGSRVDLILPADYRVMVRQGQRLRNGETVVALPGSAIVPLGDATASPRP